LLLPTRYRLDNNMVDLYGGGYWRGPLNAAGQPSDIVAGMTIAQARQSVDRGMQQSPLFRYCNNVDAHHCPADMRTKRLQPGAGWAYDSYSKADPIAGGIWNPAVVFMKESQIPTPTMTMVFIEEADPRSYNNGTWAFDINPIGWVDPFSVFHGDNSSISFADGHAESHKWREPTTVKAARDSGLGIRSFFWSGGTVGANRDMRWVYDRYRHVNWKPLP
jgi:prepilin-type processing-associated H-X9-DG protein